MTRYKPSHYAYRDKNKRTQCEVNGCFKVRHNSSQYCANHARRAQAYGHPDGRPISHKELEPYLKTAKAFLKTYADRKSTRSAIHILDALLTHGSAMATDEPDDTLCRELKRLRDGNVTGKEMLEVLSAVWLYSFNQPHWLPDDSRLTFALSRALLQTRPQTIRQISYAWGRERRSYYKPGASVHRPLGQLIRDKLGLFFINMTRHLDKQRQQEIELKQALTEPFEEASP
jgi:hypothetical protein